jgi:hypothetical protein
MKREIFEVVWTAPLVGVAGLALCLVACLAGWYDRLNSARLK